MALREFAEVLRATVRDADFVCRWGGAELLPALAVTAAHGAQSPIPLCRYKDADPFHHHPVFKPEARARLEQTMDGEEPAQAVEAHVTAWPREETMEQQLPELDSGLWSRSRDFDWGD